ncbi:MAG: PAS domain-containing protein [Gammaproteobacteria bacterium]|nr:MAG: PAS domain-containing protein [Gammaproteobacteria bacterium]
MHEVLLVSDREGWIVRVNAAACQLARRGEEALLGTPIAELLATGEARALLGNGHDPRPREARIRRNGEPAAPVSLTCSAVRMPEAGLDGLVIAAQDTSTCKRAEHRIRYLVRIHRLTKIPNRMQFQHLLQRAIARARHQSRCLGLLYIDADHLRWQEPASQPA